MLREGAEGAGREYEGFEAGGEIVGRDDGAMVGGAMAGVRMVGPSLREVAGGAITGRLLRGVSER